MLKIRSTWPRINLDNEWRMNGEYKLNNINKGVVSKLQRWGKGLHSGSSGSINSYRSTKHIFREENLWGSSRTLHRISHKGFHLFYCKYMYLKGSLALYSEKSQQAKDGGRVKKSQQNAHFFIWRLPLWLILNIKNKTSCSSTLRFFIFPA